MSEKTTFLGTSDLTIISHRLTFFLTNTDTNNLIP